MSMVSFMHTKNTLFVTLWAPEGKIRRVYECCEKKIPLYLLSVGRRRRRRRRIFRVSFFVVSFPRPRAAALRRQSLRSRQRP